MNTTTNEEKIAEGRRLLTVAGTSEGFRRMLIKGLRGLGVTCDKPVGRFVCKHPVGHTGACCVVVAL